MINANNDQLNKRISWWYRAKFGMFIHWVLYSILAGMWKGKRIPGIVSRLCSMQKFQLRSMRLLPKGLIPQSSVQKDGFKLQKMPELSGRIAPPWEIGIGDYRKLGDNEIPEGKIEGYRETPATINDTRGYKSYDHN